MRRYTDQERTAVALSRRLPDVWRNEKFCAMFGDKCDELAQEAEDYVSYNSSYYCDGQWLKPELDEDFHFKCIERHGDTFVVRIIRHHLHDELHPLCDRNRTDLNELQERAGDGDTEAIEECDRIETEFWDSIADKTYTVEVAQLHFLPDGQVVALAKRDIDEARPSGSMRPVPLDEVTPYLSWEGWDASGTTHFTLADMTPCKALDALADMVRRQVQQADINDNGEAYTLFMRAIDPRAHTLRQWGYETLWSEWMDGNEDVERFFHQIKIGHRNGMVADTAERQMQWLHLLQMVADCGGNLQDPRVFMPRDLDAAVARWSARNERRLRRLAREREIAAREEAERRALAEAERLAAAERDYTARRGAYMGIKADDGRLELTLLQNVQEFALEGLIQGHCVFSHRYYEMPDFLVFKCIDRETGEHISTVTYDIKKREVVANLGRHNQVPAQAAHINDMMRSLSAEIETVAARQTEPVAVPQSAIIGQNREKEFYRHLANGVA